MTTWTVYQKAQNAWATIGKVKAGTWGEALKTYVAGLGMTIHNPPKGIAIKADDMPGPITFGMTTDILYQFA